MQKTRVSPAGRVEMYSAVEHPDHVLLPQLNALLKEAIESGTAMTLVPPVSETDLDGLWRPILRDPKKTVFLWLVDAAPSNLASPADGHAPFKLAGTVVLIDISTGSGPFRSKVEKLVVAPEFRRQGIAEALMAALEAEALRRRLYYITLGTQTGRPAEQFYLKMGYTVEGILPGYIVSAQDGSLQGCTRFYKRLGHDPSS